MAAALLVLGACGGGPVEVTASAPRPEDADACRRLVSDLPGQVADQPSREVSEPSYAAAWGDPAIVLVCGVPTPPGFDEVAVCTTVDGVDWFIPDEDLVPGRDLTMTTVNRSVHVEVRLPASLAPPAATLADLAEAVQQGSQRTGRCR